MAEKVHNGRIMQINIWKWKPYGSKMKKEIP